MPRDACSRQAIPVVPRPAELVHRRPDGQRRIGDAPGDDDVRSLLQGLRDRLGAEVRIGADDARPDRLQRFARVEIGEWVLRQKRIEPRQQIVA